MPKTIEIYLDPQDPNKPTFAEAVAREHALNLFREFTPPADLLEAAIRARNSLL